MIDNLLHNHKKKGGSFTTYLVWSLAVDVQPPVILSAQTVTGPSSNLNLHLNDPAPYSSVNHLPTSVKYGPEPELVAPNSTETGVTVGKIRSRRAGDIMGPAKLGG